MIHFSIGPDLPQYLIPRYGSPLLYCNEASNPLKTYFIYKKLIINIKLS
jgi:hypothetical protein